MPRIVPFAGNAHGDSINLASNGLEVGIVSRMQVQASVRQPCALSTRLIGLSAMKHPCFSISWEFVICVTSC